MSSPPADPTGGPPAAAPADAALPRGLRLGGFEIQKVLARSASTIVYLATDHALAMPVALQEYLPARLGVRDAGLHLRPTEPRHEDVIARGRRAFIDEARMLAHCDHAALVRVTQLFEA
ncbi:MAG TPA: serine/threonine protein kinase, partial [Burkholderiaceae bacterium]|nr:serine/threonine protein kinase [Burkholderiaceae bacterium]